MAREAREAREEDREEDGEEDGEEDWGAGEGGGTSIFYFASEARKKKWGGWYARKMGR